MQKELNPFEKKESPLAKLIYSDKKPNKEASEDQIKLEMKEQPKNEIKKDILKKLGVVKKVPISVNESKMRQDTNMSRATH